MVEGSMIIIIVLEVQRFSSKYFCSYSNIQIFNCAWL